VASPAAAGAAALVAFLAVGLLGARGYLDNYLRYRGFAPPREPAWVTQPGTTQRTETNVPPAPLNNPAPSNAGNPSAPVVEALARPGVGDAAATGFGIKNTTSSYGLWLYDDELNFDYGKSTLSFPVKNWPSRYLTLYVQFLDSANTPIKRTDIAGWPDSMPDFLKPVFEPSDSKNYLDWIGAGSSGAGPNGERWAPSAPSSSRTVASVVTAGIVSRTGAPKPSSLC